VAGNAGVLEARRRRCTDAPAVRPSPMGWEFAPVARGASFDSACGQFWNDVMYCKAVPEASGLRGFRSPASAEKAEGLFRECGWLAKERAPANRRARWESSPARGRAAPGEVRPAGPPTGPAVASAGSWRPRPPGLPSLAADPIRQRLDRRIGGRKRSGPGNSGSLVQDSSGGAAAGPGPGSRGRQEPLELVHLRRRDAAHQRSPLPRTRQSSPSLSTEYSVPSGNTTVTRVNDSPGSFGRPSPSHRPSPARDPIPAALPRTREGSLRTVPATGRRDRSSPGFLPRLPADAALSEYSTAFAGGGAERSHGRATCMLLLCP